MKKVWSLVLSVCMVLSMLSAMTVIAGAEDVVYKKVPLDIEGFVVDQHKYTDEEIIYGIYVDDKLYVYGGSKQYDGGTCLIDVETQEIAYDFPCEWTKIHFYGTQFVLVDETLYYAETFEEIGEFFINYQTSRILNAINEGFVKDAADGKWYYLSQDGTLSDAMLSEDYVVHEYLGEGLFMYGKTRLWIGEYSDYDLYEAGIIDKEGNIICESSNEQLSFSISQGKIKIKEDGLWGYIDINGDEVIPCEYEGAGSFCDGLAAVKDNGLWGFIDEEGNEVIPFEYESVEQFIDGLAKVKKNGLWGFIDEEGNEVIPFEYEAVEDFLDGLAKVKKNDLWGFVNETGEIVIPIEYYHIGDFNDDGVAYVYDPESEREYFINKKNEEVNYSYEDTLEDEYVYSLSEEFLYGEEFEGYVIDNRTGDKVVIEGKNIRPYLMGDNNEYIFAEVDGKFYQILESDMSDFEDISFVSTIFAYDGEEKTIEIEGELPEGATVTYTNNSATDAGTYRATAVIEAEGYNTLTLSANLVINKAALTVKADDVSMIKGGEIPELTYIVEGELYGDDTITGELATKANGNKTGKFDITKGTITAGGNYAITFEKGTLTVSDKLVQNIAVGEIGEKTYGDEPFVIEVTKDEEAGLDDFSFESSNVNVAEVDENGTVTIKAAGTTKITVTQPGNETYAAFKKTQTLTVNKAALTVKADDVSMIKGGEMPELTYTVEGELYGDDTITGELATKANGNKTGKFDITQGTLKANSNYKLTFEKGTLTVSNKELQNVVVGEIGEKTYGDEPFVIEVTKDEAAGLDNFTFESSNPSVAEVSDNGTVTIKAAGETDITVTQPGNEVYAPFEKTQTLIVNKRTITVESIDLNNKVAVLSGLAEGDEVTVSFENIMLEAEITENEVVEAVVKNFALTGASAENYVVETESITSEVEKENIVEVSIEAENGTIEGTGVYLKGNNVTITAKAASKYKFSGWYAGEELVSKDATYSFSATENVNLTAQFKKKTTGGGGGSSVSYYTVKFETNGGSAIAQKSVVKNNKVTVPAEPKKEGYVFKGWFADEKLTVAYDFDTKITTNTTIYAAWEKADNSANEIVLTIDNKNAIVFGKTVVNDVAPVIRNDRTMLPARFVAENLGAKVEWNNDERKVIITKGEIEIIIIIDSDVAYVNGKEVKLDSKAFIENDRTYTPVRFIAENLGAKVEWNDAAKQVIITK